MIELYSWSTPNGRKVHIALEELGLPFRVRPVDIGRGEQFRPEFLRISPNNKIPAIVDEDGPDGGPLSVFESGAILLYLAEKTGRLLPRAAGPRYLALQWLMFQMGSLGPLLGQAHHFRSYAPEPIGYAIERYTREAGRLYAVLDRRLREAEYLAGGEYSIADVACYPWVAAHERQGQRLEEFPDLRRWFDALSARPAVGRGMALLADLRRDLGDAEARGNLFGEAQYQRR